MKKQYYNFCETASLKQRNQWKNFINYFWFRGVNDSAEVFAYAKSLDHMNKGSKWLRIMEKTGVNKSRDTLLLKLFNCLLNFLFNLFFTSGGIYPEIVNINTQWSCSASGSLCTVSLLKWHTPTFRLILIFAPIWGIYFS